MYCKINNLLQRFARQYSKAAGAKLLVERIETRSVIQVDGTGATEFLQGLVTNDMRHLDEGADCMFAMFLNAKGRVLYDSLVYKGSNPNEYYIESDVKTAEQLEAHLKMYKVRRKVNITNLNKELCVWGLHSDVLSADSSKHLLEKVRTLTENIASIDPRTIHLGLRILLPSAEELTNVLKTGELDAVEEKYYEKLRYTLGIGEGSSELPTGNCFPLEANGDYLHGVSFHKGCYIGQEVTARTHHTGVVRKRLMPIFVKDDNVNIEYDAQVINHEGKTVGKVRGACEKMGLALLRVEEAMKAENLQVCGQQCQTTKPAWWPQEAPKGRPP